MSDNATIPASEPESGEANPMEITPYLEHRLGVTRRRKLGLLVGNTTAMVLFVVLVVAGMRQVSQYSQHPQFLVNDVDHTLRPRLPEIRKSLERQILTSTRKGISNAFRELERSLSRMPAEMRRDEMALADHVIDDFTKNSTQALTKIATEQRTTLKTLLADTDTPEGRARLTSFLKDHLDGVLAKSFEHRTYGYIDSFVAIKNRLSMLKNGEDKSAEAFLEQELVTIITGPVRMATQK